MEANEQPPKAGSLRKKWGKYLLIGGAILCVLSLGSIASAGLTMFGGLASGGMVPGHGQDEIARSASSVAQASAGLVFGAISAFVGLVMVLIRTRE